MQKMYLPLWRIKYLIAVFKKTILLFMTIRLRQGIMGKEEDIRLDQKVRAAWMYYIAGLNQSEIASQLYITLSTVKTHIASLMTKLDARNRVEIAIWAHQTGRMRPRTST